MLVAEFRAGGIERARPSPVFCAAKSVRRSKRRVVAFRIAYTAKMVEGCLITPVLPAKRKSRHESTAVVAVDMPRREAGFDWPGARMRFFDAGIVPRAFSRCCATYACL